MRAATFKAVSVIDPALDTEAITEDDMVRYFQMRDFAIVDGKWKPGQKPTIYHLREVPHDLWESFVMRGENESEQFAYAFRAGVVKAENVYGADGVAVALWEPAKKGTNAITAKEAERFSPAERAEIGSVVFQHSFLPLRTECIYRLPSSVAAHLARRAFLLADKSQNSAEATSSDAHSADSAHQTAATVTTTGESAAASA